MKPEEYAGKTVLIVGNGPSAAKAHIQRVLHMFDLVMRINNWKPLPEVGDRCDIWMTSLNINMEYDKPIYKTCDIWHSGWPFKHTDANFQKAIAPRLAILRTQINRQPTLIAPEAYLRTIWSMLSPSHPSTGLVAVQMALLMQMKPAIVGFDMFQGEQLHYYAHESESPWPESISESLKWHNPQREWDILTHLTKTQQIGAIQSASATPEPSLLQAGSLGQR